MRYVVIALAIFFSGCASKDNEALMLCGNNECCKKSLEIIREHGYTRATDNLCQEGKKLNSLGCVGSLRWCE